MRGRPNERRWARGTRAQLTAFGIVVAAGLVSAPGHAQERAVQRGLLPAFHVPTVHLEVSPPADGGFEEPYFPFMPGEDPRSSLSVGDTSHGFLVNAVPIDESAALGILPVQKKRDLAYGSRELVAMLDHAARALHQATQTRLWLGNVARRGGGDIEWSVSHNSGRDADIAFAYTNRKGEPVDPPDLVPLNGEGLAKHHDLRFDAARTWIIIKALLTFEGAQVQYLFLSNSLKNLVLAQAAKAREPAWLIERAAAVVRQPGGSAPHHDHLHLRIYCTERDIEAGCQNTGVIHPWAKLYEAARDRAAKRFAALLSDEGTMPRRRAIERLALLDARDQAGAIATHLDDEDATVRGAAARALARIGSEAEVAALVHRFEHETDVEAALAIIQAVGAIGGKTAGGFLASAVGRPSLDPRVRWSTLDAAATVRGPALFGLLPEAAIAASELARDHGLVLPGLERSEGLVLRLAAIEAASRSERLEPVEPLIELLTDRDPRVRVQAAEALRMITNLTYHVAWDAASAATRSAAVDRWRAAFSQTKKAPRRAWLALGFTAAGYRVPELRQKHAWELVRAVAGADHNSYNAQRALMELFDHHPPSLSWSKGEACRHWLRFIEGRRASYSLERPPDKVLRICR
jgi:HEAT repeat protein/murein endopeptidase